MTNKPGPVTGEADRKRAERHREYLRKCITGMILCARRSWPIAKAAERIGLPEDVLKGFIDTNLNEMIRKLDSRSK